MKTIILVLGILLNVAFSFGQSGNWPSNLDRDTVDIKIGEWIEPYNQLTTPGGIIMVMQDGKIVYQKAFGMANLQHHVPFTEKTLTNIGSTSKQFTAFAIALLERQGLLAFSDDIRKYIPELPDLGQTVTLAHLISHTSGYREIFNTFMMSGIGMSDQIRRTEVVPMIQRQPELQNIPGESWNYNNTGYILLSMVIEKVSGIPFDQWLEENVFKPLDMQNTLVRMDPRQVIKGSAQGYGKDEKENYIERTDLYCAAGAGGIYTTAEDLAKWIGNYLEPELGDKSLVEMMTTPYVLNSGEKTNYGFGLMMDKLNGLERFQHGGADVAHRSQFFVFPTVRGAVVTLSNNAGFASDVAGKVAELFFSESMEMKPADTFNFDQEYLGFKPERFDGFAGRYAMKEAPDFILEFEREGEKYYTTATGQPKFEIFPGSDSTFFLKVVRAGVTFHQNSEGATNSITLHQNGLHRADRIMEEAWKPSPEELSSYKGRYFCDELETFYLVEVNDSNRLVLRHRRIGDIELKANKPDSFNGTSTVSVVNFIRDDNGQITGFKASNGRALNVVFSKMAETE